MMTALAILPPGRAEASEPMDDAMTRKALVEAFRAAEPTRRKLLYHEQPTAREVDAAFITYAEIGVWNAKRPDVAIGARDLIEIVPAIGALAV